jgi:hypothetical protein
MDDVEYQDQLKKLIMEISELSKGKNRYAVVVAALFMAAHETLQSGLTRDDFMVEAERVWKDTLASLQTVQKS